MLARNDDGMKVSSPVFRLCGLSFSLSLGLLLTILACTYVFDPSLPPNTLPLLAAAVHLASPCPTFFCGRRGCAAGSSAGYAMLAAGSSDSTTWCQDVGYFVNAVLMTLGVGIPALLAHTQAISIGAALVSILGGIVVYATTSGYFYAFTTSNE